jgi:hypothetical protein
MLRNLVLAYLGGAATIGATVYAAGGRATIVSFTIGFFFAIALAAAALSSTSRLRRAGRFLFAVAHALDRDRRHRTAPKTKATPIRTPAASPQPPALPSQAEEDLYTALVNFGARKAAARAAARYAIAQAPAADFSTRFRIALNQAKAAA